MCINASVSTRRAYVTLFFATFLVAYGLVLVAMQMSDESADHRMLVFSLMMTAVGALGVVSAVTKNRKLVILLMICLVYLTAVTFRVVYTKLSEKKQACPDLASHIEAHRESIFLEAMPGLFVEVNSQIRFSIAVDMKSLGECEQRVQTMWVYSIFILFDILISLQICLWRFLSAIKAEALEAEKDREEKQSLLQEEELIVVKEEPEFMPRHRPVYLL
eukprot:TRINITY_DN6774_c0_g2_i1.p1 TRINITY_DN6774_c0_g2~~TRINITY_DN6774_c0_g2_i1.p1  ORF type:complete len:218 (+),score=26.04 TRINITY_DN6774_c0_g2_i1:53-706(+)